MEKLVVLHLEDNPDDAFFVKKFLDKNKFNTEVVYAGSREEFISALDMGRPDLVLSDHRLPGFGSEHALQMAKEKYPGVPFVVLSGLARDEEAKAAIEAGATGFIQKNQLWQLVPLLRSIYSGIECTRTRARLVQVNHSMQDLVRVVRELSQARDLQAIMDIVRKSARELTGADGATFVLRDGDKCYYAEEDAIAPLWKGMRFQMSQCVSGWAMLNKQAAVIEDIYSDPRVPADAYRSTFVKSMVMMPIRVEAPVGAIGCYWRERHSASPDEIKLLQALADTAAVAMENVHLYQELESRVKVRTVQLEAANQELEAFSYSVAHDLRSPLHIINVYTLLLLEEHQKAMAQEAAKYLGTINNETQRMNRLIEDLMRLAGFTSAELNSEEVDLSSMAGKIMEQIRAEAPQREAEVNIQDNMWIKGDAGLLKIALENLLQNAWKYSAKCDRPSIAFGMASSEEGSREFFVKDKGAGFDMRYADRLFVPFQRLHSDKDFVGTGIGLATVQRIIRRHGGSIRAEAEPGNGATFYFSLPAA